MGAARRTRDSTLERSANDGHKKRVYSLSVIPPSRRFAIADVTPDVSPAPSVRCAGSGSVGCVHLDQPSWIVERDPKFSCEAPRHTKN
jgi:hypothetical protein